MTASLRKISLILLICVIGFQGFAQNFIGQHKDVIRKNALKYYTGFNFDKEVENGNKSFLKYVNNLEEQTLLFILNDKGYCTSISRMYNTWLYNKVRNELNKKYKQKDSMTWLEINNNKVYEITLKKGKWFITVTTRPSIK